MVSGTTSSGFKYSVDEGVIASYEFLNAIQVLQSGDNTDKLRAAVSLPDILLGKAGKNDLLEHVRGNESFADVNRVMKEIAEIIQKLSAESSQAKK